MLHLGRDNKNSNYQINGEPLIEEYKEKHVGVLILANQILGQTLQKFIYRDKYHFVKQLRLRFHLYHEYCVQAWSLWLLQDIELLENVQRRAVNSVFKWTGTYEEN